MEADPANTTAASAVVPGRSCGTCTLCCKLMRIPELDKPRLEWCPNCEVGKGCRIYPERPSSCRAFHCGYLMFPYLDARWFPAKARIVVAFQATRLAIHVDPARPAAWRQEPFYSQIRGWALQGARTRRQVLVWQGNEVIALLPDGEKSLGAVRDDQLIITREKRGPDGRMRWDAFVAERDDPRYADWDGRPVPPRDVLGSG